jgi:hypothetical protein
MMTLYVVVDLLGAGRIVGVFDERSRAEKIIGGFGHYYKLHEIEMNRVDPAVLGWAVNDEQRAWLRQFLDECSS